MFSRILVPLDGSERAARALPVAARVARVSGGTLVLLQVLNAPAELLPYVVPGIEPSTLGADLQGATNYLASLAALPEVAGVPVEVEVHAGLAPSMILAMARSRQAALIVLSSHGRSGLARWALGSVAQKVARHAEVPVLLLRQDSLASSGSRAAPERPLRALVALDGSPAAEAALGPAAQLIVALAAPAPAALHLVQVVAPSASDVVASDYLRATAERLRAATPADLQLDVSWSLVRDEDAAHALARTAETGERADESADESADGGTAAPGASDLIALTTYGASGHQAWAMGGVAERLLHSTKLPLLLLRPSEATAAETEV
ncbi:MAG: universal stress protein [Ktedonobacterales bacterium]|nr:universal stress protein [Ktedonobacterales bacterium]